jgi:hypothetical protein
MNVTLSKPHDELPTGTVVEINRMYASPERVLVDKFTYEGNWHFNLRLDPDQIKGLIPFAPGLTRVVSQAGEGRSLLLWHWIKSGGPEGRTGYFVDPEGTYSGAPEDVPVRALINYDTDAQIDRLMEQVSSGGILVIDHVERVQCDNLTDIPFLSGHHRNQYHLALGHFLARLGFVAKRRGVMVIAAVQLRRSGAPTEGIRVYPPEGGAQ